MKIYEELIGREFDWYALDEEGNIGMFASGGSLIVPKKVLQFYEEYDDISELIDEPNFGSEAVWQDSAKLGFYVFETDMSGKKYTKRAEPICKMNDELKQKILSLSNLPVYEIKFREIGSFIDVESWIK